MFQVLDALGYFALLSAAAIAGTAGIGGGGIHVALLIALFGFEYSEACIYSFCLVCGSCFCQAIINSHIIHPLVNSDQQLM